MTPSGDHPGTGGQPSVSAAWTGRTRGGLAGNWIFVTLVRFLGLRPAYALLAFVSFYYLFTAPDAVRASGDYLARVGGGGSGWLARYWGVWRHFYCFGQILLDRVAIMSGSAGRFSIDFQGEKNLRDALAGGKGLLVLTAHCGNWEAAGHLLGRLSVPVNVVAYEGEAQQIRRLFDRALTDRSFSLILADGSADTGVAITAALSRGEIVAMHGDRTVGSRGLVVPFLNSPARFPVGPYAVAAVTGAPLIHAFAMREGIYRYRFFAYPPERLSFDAGRDRDGRLQQWLSAFVCRLEEKLRQYPLQWCNFYDFWAQKTIA